MAGRAPGRRPHEADVAAGEASLQIVAQDQGQGIVGVVAQVDLAVPIAQPVGIQLDVAAEGGPVVARQAQVELALQAVRRLGPQVQVQGIATQETTRLGQVLIRLQPAQLDFWQRAAVLGQHIQAQRPERLCRKADLQLALGVEIVPLAQAQHAADQLAALRRERLAVELPAERDGQFRRRPGLRLQPAQAEDRLQSRSVVTGQQRQADHQRDATQRGQPDALARRTPVHADIGQCHRREKAAVTPQQTGTEGQDDDPDIAGDHQQQAAQNQQGIHRDILSPLSAAYGSRLVHLEMRPRGGDGLAPGWSARR